MDKNLILKGTAKYFRIGSKGNRYKLIIDDIVLSDFIENEIKNSVEKHKVDYKNPILDAQDFIRLKLIEIRLVDVKK